MKKNRFKPAIFLLVLFPVCCFSQVNNNNSLLWRISGNGINGPSYLFGTIHLNDARVFNLGDSLYQAIAVSKGFAMELDPQQLTLYVIDEMKKQLSDPRKLSAMLSGEEYKKYGPILEKKLNKKQKDITSSDILREKNKWIVEKFKTGKMQTFLDAYLFDIARRQGKWTGGVEQLDDQRNLGLDVVDESDIRQIANSGDSNHQDAELEKMINAYVHSDLDLIESMSLSGDSLRNDKIIFKRNMRMASSMDSLARIRTMVFAVGAAHLPGRGGVIDLLRKRGFRVDPVFSSKQIRASEYVFKEKPVEWKTITDNNSLYRVSMPGRAEDLKIYGVMVMKVNMDIFQGNAYFTTAVTTPIPAGKIDSAMDAMSLQMFPGKNTKSKPVHQGGAAGKEYSTNADGIFRKGYILYRNHKLFVAMAANSHESREAISDITRFLTSFRLTDDTTEVAANPYRFRDSTEAYELEIPEKPQYMDELSGVREKEGVLSRVYASIDNKKGIYYFFGTNMLLPGRYIDNDSTYLIALGNSLKGKFEAISRDIIYTNENTRVLEMAGALKENKLLRMITRYYLRGNRWYAQVAMVGMEKPDSEVMPFFNSFRFLDFPEVAWGLHTSSDSVITAWTPAPITTLRNDFKSEKVDQLYDATDSIRAHSYDIVAWHFNDYFWAGSDSAFWAERIASKLSPTDSLIYKKPVLNGDVPGWEFEKLAQGSHNYERYRLLRYGNQMYSILSQRPVSATDTQNINRFFESVRFKKPLPPGQLLESHAGLLLDDLFAQDSSTAADALSFLGAAPFPPSDLDTLQNTLARKDIYLHPQNITDQVQAITSKITALHDSSSFRFAKDLYPRVPDSNSLLKNALLVIMASFPSPANFNIMADQLSHSIPLEGISIDFINALKDTARLTSMVISRLLPLLKNENSCGTMMNLCVSLTDSSLLPPAKLLPWLPDCIHYSDNRLKKMLMDTDDFSYNDFQAIRFFESLKDPAANKQIRKYLDIKENYIRFQAVKSLIRNKQAVAAAVYLSLAADKYYRVDLYNLLRENHKMTLFPASYKTPERLAESQIWNASDEDEPPASVKFVSQKQIRLKGESVSLYFFRIAYDQDDATTAYLACSGPFKNGEIADTNQTVEFYFDHSFSSGKMKEQQAELIKRYQAE